MIDDHKEADIRSHLELSRRIFYNIIRINLIKCN